MGKTITIIFAVAAVFFGIVLLTVCNGNSCKLYSVYKNDRDNDGVVDAVYRYTLDINDNMIKVEIDPHNDGHFQKGCCYNLGAEMKCDLSKRLHGG